MLYSSKGSEPLSGQVSAPIVVVGTGPGGATTARELAASGRNVLMIEAGPFLQPSDYSPFSMEEMVAKYRNQGLTLALGSPKIQYAEACCVGGGSEINSGLYHRVPEEILNRWQIDYEIEGLAADDLQPHFRQIESDLEISTSELPPAPASQKLADGARKLGWDAVEVPRWTVYNRETAAREPVMGDRRTMVRTYLDDFLRMGGRILAETTVISLKRVGSKWRLKCVYRGNRGRPAQLSILCRDGFHGLWRNSFPRSAPTKRDKKKYW